MRKKYNRWLADLAALNAYKDKSNLGCLPVPGSDLVVPRLMVLHDLSEIYGTEIADQWPDLGEKEFSLLMELKTTPDFTVACQAFVEGLIERAGVAL